MSEGRTSPAPASLPGSDDMLGEILLRLPPLPSALPRASLVCKRWRRLVFDPQFIRRFRVRHRTPPLLGFFYHRTVTDFVFVPTLDPPDRIPPACFSLPQHTESRRFLGCRLPQSGQNGGCCLGTRDWKRVLHPFSTRAGV
ncbi:hypothetical protein QOZ80_5AG0376210 [Eleusine coracana subsp. coracana]|nr:hypothetical protein QOZ80_5AG0376210 [Eleusine coracana subsp. coracana]